MTMSDHNGLDFADLLAQACSYCRKRIGLSPADEAPETCQLCPTTRPVPTTTQFTPRKEHDVAN